MCSRAGLHWSLPAWLATSAKAFGRWVLVAAPLDAAENIGLYWLIAGSDDEGVQWFVTAVSGAKWLIALACLAVASASLAYLGYRRLASTKGDR